MRSKGLRLISPSSTSHLYTCRSQRYRVADVDPLARSRTELNGPQCARD